MSALITKSLNIPHQKQPYDVADLFDVAFQITFELGYK
ncbi:hypothetical protein T03_9716 [Trichinella britovi]|uniref:Uncharacterized protein n=1 Tax=Trichinella britovi TaxID=45882 RepID=A0A0V0Z076_TRIBR|nr:hypothetical protein T03_9716 [Trichinella britovi]